MRIEEEIDLSKIRDDDPIEAFEAAKRRIVESASPDLIQELIDTGTDTHNRTWVRAAALYVLGFVDHDAISEPAMWEIARCPDEDNQIREYAEDCLYLFAQCRRARESSCTDANTYADRSFVEWRAEQVGLPVPAAA